MRVAATMNTKVPRPSSPAREPLPNSVPANIKTLLKHTTVHTRQLPANRSFCLISFILPPFGQSNGHCVTASDSDGRNHPNRPQPRLDQVRPPRDRKIRAT